VFDRLDLHPRLLDAVAGLGFTRPTPIQADAIPPALAGRDVLASAATGSGKTAAFLLPIAHRLLERPRGTTRALVLTPTRELAAQILADFRSLSAGTRLTGAVVHGGVAIAPQVEAFRRGVDIIVATPGRLLDHFRSPHARLDALESLVLDEADRMLDMGFLPDIRRILARLPAKRQTLFFSATMPAPIQRLARELLHDPVTVSLQKEARPAEGITHAAYPVRQTLKSALLLALLRQGAMRQALVFTRTKHRANRLANYLVQNGIGAERIHGNRSQAQRTAALAGFRSGSHRVLVATDVAARGIDIALLGHVVNFDVPAFADDYIHRVGRTARAEATGDALTFVAPEEETTLRSIEQAVGRRIDRRTVPGFNYAERAESLEIPIAERIAAAREGRARGRARTAARTANAESVTPAGPQRRGPASDASNGGSRRRRLRWNSR
jgi:ATP-dependent RNA helicase RhlE